MSRTYYVDTVFGSDSLGDGSVARPYRTLTLAASLLDHGDEIAVNDAGPNNVDEIVFNEPDTVVFDGKLNISLRFLKAPGKSKTSMVWKPTLVNPASRANLHIKNCTNVRVEGAIFLSQSPLTDHAHAVLVENSSEVVVSGCEIHRDWTVDNSPGVLLARLWTELTGLDRTIMEYLYGYNGQPLKTVAETAVLVGKTEDYVQNKLTMFSNRMLYLGSGELFSGRNSNMTISGCSGTAVNNSYSNYLAFIAVDGAGEYSLFSNTFQSSRANNGTTYGIRVKPETRKVTVDGFLCHDIKTDLADHAIGIQIESDNSQTEFLVNGAQLSTMHIGIKLLNIPNGMLTRRIKRSTFFNVRRAIWAENAIADVFNISAHSSPTTTHEYPPGHTQTLETFGVFAYDHSNISVTNSIFTGFGTALYAESYSAIQAEYMVWNLCSVLKNAVAPFAKVTTVQYVRRVDPKYENLGAAPYGSFLVADDSPCIDSGKKYGDAFLGLAPDIGAIERSRALRVDDLPALIARTNRFTTRVPLTNIDIEGMIVRGLDTYDPEVQAGREGSAIKDIAVKPLVGLMAPYTTELESIRNGLSLTNIGTMSPEAADALASNLYVERRQGDLASGIVRIYFESPTVAVIPAEAEFRTNGGLKYFTRQEVSVSAEEMNLNYENNLYYVDVIVEAETVGAEYNTLAETIASPLTPMPPGVVAVSNPQEITGGDNSESNGELAERIKTAITVRDLVTKKGISFVIPDQFPFVKEIRPIGFKDPEMLRDEILGYHIGGKVDIYIRPQALVEDSKVIEVANAEIPLTLQDWGNVPIVQITGIEVLDPETLDTTDVWVPESQFSIRVNEPKTRFSVNENNTLLISKNYVGLPLRVYYRWASEIRALQLWVESSEDRVVCADLLVKHFLPSFVDFNVSYYADAEIDGMDTLLKVLVNDIKNTMPLQVSDIVDACYNYGADYVSQPMPLLVRTHMSDGTILEQESETEVLIDRTSVFVANNITVNYLGVDPNS